MDDNHQWIPIAGLLITIGICVYMVAQLGA
jgi:hypothetical protein